MCAGAQSGLMCYQSAQGSPYSILVSEVVGNSVYLKYIFISGKYIIYNEKVNIINEILENSLFYAVSIRSYN